MAARERKERILVVLSRYTWGELKLGARMLNMDAENARGKKMRSLSCWFQGKR